MVTKPKTGKNQTTRREKQGRNDGRYPSGPIFNTEDGKIHIQQTEAPVKARHRNYDTRGHSASELPELGKTLNTLKEPHDRAYEAAGHDGDGRGLSAIEVD